MFVPRQTLLALAVLSIAAALGACGGDGGDAAAAGSGTDATGLPAAGGGGTNTGGAGTNTAGGGTNPTGGGTNAAGGGTTTAGGSGGTTSPAAGSAGSAAQVVSPAGTLQTSIAPDSYADGSFGDSALTALNSARQGAGAGVMNQSPQLDVAAEAHATYLSSNIGAVGHDEEATKINFFEVSPQSRIARAGFKAGFSTETISVRGTLLGSNCVQQLLNSIYNAVAMLSPATHVGFGYSANFATTPICVSDLAALSSEVHGQVAGAGSLLTYPYAGQDEVLESFDVNIESPRPPLALFPNATAGTPVIVNVRNADYLNLMAAGTLNAVVTRFELTDQNGNRIPAAILANPSIKAGAAVTLNADSALLTGAAVLVPLAPLLRAQSYTVAFSATLETGSPALEKTWAFTTRP